MRSTKPTTSNQEALLTFIRSRFAETKEPVTEREILLARVVPSRFRVTATVGLIDRGLIAVPTIGTAAWVPVEGA